MSRHDRRVYGICSMEDQGMWVVRIAGIRAGESYGRVEVR